MVAWDTFIVLVALAFALGLCLGVGLAGEAV